MCSLCLCRTCSWSRTRIKHPNRRQWNLKWLASPRFKPLPLPPSFCCCLHAITIHSPFLFTRLSSLCHTLLIKMAPDSTHWDSAPSHLYIRDWDHDLSSWRHDRDWSTQKDEGRRGGWAVCLLRRRREQDVHAASFTDLSDVHPGSQWLLSVSQQHADLKSRLLLLIEDASF